MEDFSHAFMEQDLEARDKYEDYFTRTYPTYDEPYEPYIDLEADAKGVRTFFENMRKYDKGKGEEDFVCMMFADRMAQLEGASDWGPKASAPKLAKVLRHLDGKKYGKGS